MSYFDKVRQSKSIKKIEDKISLDVRLDTEFDQGPYFKYVVLKDTGNNTDKKSAIKDKLNGRYYVRKTPQLSEVDRLAAISNDDMVYYMFKKNKLFK